MKRFIAVVLVSVISGFGGAYLFNELNAPQPDNDQLFTQSNVSSADYPNPNQLAHNNGNISIDMDEDFVDASSLSTASVVYIKNISKQSYGNSFLDLFFGNSGRSIETVSSGSGVIISQDGYIVSNNHVVQGANKIQVIHNKNTYQAELIGTDPSSDLAVLKIDANNLPAIKTGSSKDLKVGEWVLAVGNPFNLTSTVTAGIVSAKGRELNILKSNFPIESFIQTDAAINPGNSGGALVNKNGELVGINTAILSRTGSYAGYGFAVPIDIVSKIVNDIIQYGEVQKAFFGGSVSDLNTEVAEKLDLKVDPNNIEGVVIDYVQRDGAAEKAGLKEGDILLEINGEKIDSRSMFEEMISYSSPGDIIDIKVERKGRLIEERLTLTNRNGTTEIVVKEIYASEYLGADLEVVSKVESDLLDIDQGVKIVKMYDRGLFRSLGLDEGFIITSINYTDITTPEEVNDYLTNYQGRVRIEGVDPAGRKGYYNFYLR